MTFELLDTIVLNRDLSEHGLRKGDLGAIVEIYPPDGLDVEFVTASGRTQALVTLKVSDVRPVEDQDLVAVRRVDPGQVEAVQLGRATDRLRRRLTAKSVGRTTLNSRGGTTVSVRDVVQQLVHAIEQGDAESYAQLFAADAIQRHPLAEDPLHGREAVRQGEQALFDAFSDIGVEVRSLVGDSPRVLVEVLLRATNTGPLDLVSRA